MGSPIDPFNMLGRLRYSNFLKYFLCKGYVGLIITNHYLDVSFSYRQITPSRGVAGALVFLPHFPWPPEPFTGQLDGLLTHLAVDTVHSAHEQCRPRAGLYLAE